MPSSLIVSNLKLRKFLGKIRLLIESLKKYVQKNPEATLLFVNCSKTFDSIHRGKIEQIFLAYGFPREIVTIIMMLYKNMEAMVCLPDGDTDFFDIVTRVLQGDTLAPFQLLSA